jgi:hypothetical protein
MLSFEFVSWAFKAIREGSLAKIKALKLSAVNCLREICAERCLLRVKVILKVIR